MAKSTEQSDIRWVQRLKDLEAAHEQLKDAVTLSQQRKLSDLEQQGLIQAFEFTHELAWNVMKDYFDFQGGAELITGSRDASREAFNKGLVNDGDAWMEMIKSRNQTSNTYKKKVASEIIEKICSQYFQSIDSFLKTMTKISQK